MRAYTLSHVRDQELLRNLHTLVAQDRGTTAELIAHIGEVDMRRLHLPAAYPSMHAYCVHELRLSEDAALKRIRAARAARRFPVIFEAVADGRLSLSAVVLLAPHLRPENAAGLLGAAYGLTRSAIEVMLAERFPQSELLALVQPLTATSGGPADEVAPGPVAAFTFEVAPGPPVSPAGELAPGPDAAFTFEVAPGPPVSPTEQPAPGPVEKRSTLKPHAAGRYALQFTIGQETYDKLQQAQAMLSHALPSGEIAAVIDRALDVLIAQLGRRKCGAARKPRTPRRRASVNPRSIPAHIRNAVWARDGGQCTFVSAAGQRCTARHLLEFDHVDPVARGGQATVAGIRLLCRAHNQFEAERMYGAGFMEQKREQAQRAVEARPPVDEHAPDIVAGLRNLRYNANEARQAAQYSATIQATTLEARMRAALQYLAPRARRQEPS